MKQLLPYAQLIISVLLMGAILLQQRSAGAGSAFGGDGSVYSTRRGLEKKLFIATILLGILFFISALLSIFLR